MAKPPPPPKESDDAWMTSYSDVVTSLMAFFVFFPQSPSAGPGLKTVLERNF